jgi:hypothetical protein
MIYSSLSIQLKKTDCKSFEVTWLQTSWKALAISSTLWKLRSLVACFNILNDQKSHGLISGESSGCGTRWSFRLSSSSVALRLLWHMGIVHLHKKSHRRTLWRIHPIFLRISGRMLLTKYSWVNRAPGGSACRLISFISLQKIVNVTFWARIVAFVLGITSSQLLANI